MAKRKLDTLLKYNALDCVRTAQIWGVQKHEFSEDKQDEARRRLLYEHQLRLADVAAKMSYNGFPVDRKMMAKLAEKLKTMGMGRALKVWRLLRPYTLKGGDFRITPSGGVNESDLAALIYRESARPKEFKCFGLEVPMGKFGRTDTGRPAVNKKALLYLMAAGQCPPELKEIIRACWQADAPLKALGTYILSEKVTGSIGPDERLHAHINSCGTETGRWSCTRPNLFNLSEAKDEEAGSLQGDLPNVRGIYTAPKGMVIVHRDFSQFELQIMAAITGDALLINALATGDVHTARTREWFNLGPNDPVPKQVRHQAKVVGLMSQYSAGLEAVWVSCLEQLEDLPYEVTAALWQTFRDKHPGIVAHWARSLDFAESYGYNETAIMHRRRYYPPGPPLLATETSNYAIQGTAADIANCCMAGKTGEELTIPKLLTKFKGSWLCMHTYDSFDVICKKEHAESLKDALGELMQGPWEINGKLYTLPSDGKIGERWSEV